MDEELTILTNPDGSGPVVISIGVPAGAAPDVITSTSTNGNDTKSRRGKCFVYIAVFTVFLNCISCSAMIYASILVNETNSSFCIDEVKKMKRDFQWRMMRQCFVQCFAFMIQILYLVFGKFDQGDDLFFACSTVAVLILELIKMKIGYDYDANEQITSSQDVQY